ncbi:hypothetical protein MSG28_006938, partial [Choristoneura fumiferana]
CKNWRLCIVFKYLLFFQWHSYGVRDYVVFIIGPNCQVPLSHAVQTAQRVSFMQCLYNSPSEHHQGQEDYDTLQTIGQVCYYPEITSSFVRNTDVYTNIAAFAAINIEITLYMYIHIRFRSENTTQLIIHIPEQRHAFDYGRGRPFAGFHGKQGFNRSYCLGGQGFIAFWPLQIYNNDSNIHSSSVTIVMLKTTLSSELVRRGGYCGTSLSRISLNCSIGHMLLKDVIVSGTKLSTEDTPDLITVEDPSQYCLGQMYRNASEPGRGTIPVAVACFQEFKSEKTPIEVTGFLTLVSVLFLLVTLAVYMYLPQMRDLQGQCYMCMCISMAIGFLVYFWMMATFFWMNVISINVYRTVIDASYLKKTERKQYALYSCYAWGCSVVLLFVALVTNFVEGDHLKPGIGTTACWFQGK